MPQAQLEYTTYFTPKLLRYLRNIFAGTGVNNYAKPPAQNPDMFELLTNVMPVTTNVIQRRWGYTLWNSSNPIEARLAFPYRNNTTSTRRIILTAGDGTGTASTTNAVNVYDENGVFKSALFTPSGGAGNPYMVNSRDYAYFADGVSADLKKWDGTTLTKWGIAAPIAAPIVTAVSTALTAWQASTMYTTMGLLVDANNNVEQLVSVNAKGTNTTQYGSSASGQPNWSTPATPGSTTTDNTVTWTSLGQISLWKPSTHYNGFAAIYDPGSNAIFTAPSGGGTTGTTYPSFINRPVDSNGNLTEIADSGGFSWACSGTPVLWKASTLYPAWWEHPNAFCCEPILPTQANLQAGNQPIYFQIANVKGTYPNFVGANGATGTSAASYTPVWPTTAGQQTSDGDLVWIELGSKGWQASHAYNQFTTGGTAASAIVDANGNWQVVVASTGNSGLSVPTWATTFGTQTVDNAVTWVNCGSATNSTWAVSTQWYFPYGGFIPPSTVSTISSASIKDANGNQEYVTASGKSGTVVPTWATSKGSTTTDNQVTWTNNGAASTQAGNVTFTLGGCRYFAVFRNDTSGNMSDLSPVSSITGNLTSDIVQLTGIPTSSDAQVSSVYLLRTADGGDETTLYLAGSVLNGTTTFADNMPESMLLIQNVYQETDQFGNLIGVANNQPPPSGTLPIYHRGRLYLLLGNTLFFSKSLGDLVTSTGTVCGRFEECWPPGNQLNISSIAEVPRGLATDGSVLYIGTEREIHRLLGDGPSNFGEPEIVFNESGLLNQQVWKAIFIENQPVGMMWLSPDNRVIGSDFNTYLDAGHPIQATLNSINKSAASKAWAVFVSNGPYDLFLLAIPTASNTECDTLCVFDLRNRQWTVWTPTDTVTAGCFNIDSTGQPRWIFSASTGDAYEFISTGFQDRQGNTPVNYTATIRTSWFSPFDISMRKLINEVQIITGDTNATITVEGANTQADFSTPTTLVSGVSLQTGTFGDLMVPLVGATSKFRYYRLTLTSTSAIQELLEGFSFEVVPFNRV